MSIAAGIVLKEIVIRSWVPPAGRLCWVQGSAGGAVGAVGLCRASGGGGTAPGELWGGQEPGGAALGMGTLLQPLVPGSDGVCPSRCCFSITSVPSGALVGAVGIREPEELLGVGNAPAFPKGFVALGFWTQWPHSWPCGDAKDGLSSGTLRSLPCH